MKEGQYKNEQKSFAHKAFEYGATVGTSIAIATATIVNVPQIHEYFRLQKKVDEPVKTEKVRTPTIFDAFVDLADGLISIEKHDPAKQDDIIATIKTKDPVPLDIRPYRTILNDGRLRAFIPLQPDKDGNNVSTIMFLKQKPVLITSAVIAERVYSATFTKIPQSEEAIFTMKDDPQEIEEVNKIINTDKVRVIVINKGKERITLQMLPNTQPNPKATSDTEF